jgi:trigger factor
MAMQVTVGAKDENNIVTIDIETEPGYAKDAYSKTVRKLGGSVNIKGFRKGKAPLKVIEEHVGPERIRAEVMSNNFISNLFEEVFKQEELNVLHIPGIEKLEFNDPEDSIKISAKLELYPDVSLPDYSGFNLTVKVPKIELDKQINETLDRVQLNNSKFEESDSPVEMGDEIVFDFDGSYLKEDGTWEPKPGMKAESYQTIVESGRFIDNFLEQMVGMKAGEEKELEVQFPENYHDADLNGKPAKFKVKIHTVSKPSKPDLNDEFAKTLGLETMEEVRKKIQEEIERVSALNKKNIISEAVMKEMLDRTEMNISRSMIQRELDNDLAIMQKQRKWNDTQLKDFIGTLDMEKEEAAAEDKLRRSVILTTIIKQEKFEVSPEEIQAAFSQYRFPQDFDLSKVDLGAVASKLNMDLLAEKALEHIVNKANIQTEEVAPEELPHDHPGHVHGAHCNH